MNLFSKLRDLVLDQKNKFVFVHSDVSLVLKTNPKYIWSLLDFFEELANEGITIIYPAYDFRFCKSNIKYSDLRHNSTGYLATLVYKRIPNTYMTGSPVYSHIIMPSLTFDQKFDKSESAWGINSLFEYIEDKCLILYINCDLTRTTLFHRYEQLANVPYREYKTFDGKLISLEGKTENIHENFFTRSALIDAKNDWTVLIDKLTPFTNVLWNDQWKITTISSSIVKEITSSLLLENKYALVANPEIIKDRCTKQSNRNRNTPLTIYPLTFGNPDGLTNSLKKFNSKLFNYEGVIAKTKYNSISTFPIESSKLDPSHTILVFDDTLDSFDFNFSQNFESFKLCVEKLTELFEDALENGYTIICRFPSRTFHQSDISPENYLPYVYKEFLNYILELQFKSENFILHNTGLLGGYTERIDNGLFFRAKITSTITSKEQTLKSDSSLVKELNRIFYKRSGLSMRLIVLDLDNTLWSGILGEDTKSQVLYDGDYPGNLFKQLQILLLNLMKRGILLAVISKNDLKDVESHFENANMVLKIKNFCSIMAGWKEKSIYMSELISLVNISTANVMFIDDNPIERKKMSESYPLMHIPDSAMNTIELIDYLLNTPLLPSTFSYFDQDTEKTNSNRISSIKFRKEFSEVQSNTTTKLDKFFQSLNTSIKLRPLTNQNLSRAAQIVIKTNQFNTSLIRYSEPEIEEFVKNGNSYIAEITDNYTNNDLIGLILASSSNNPGSQNLMINSFLLSCRVLGRGVEHSILEAFISRVINSYQQIYGITYEGPRNTPALNIFSDNGFIPCKPPPMVDSTFNCFMLSNAPVNEAQNKYHISVEFTL